MTYVATPTDPTHPLDGDDASGGAAELRALKGYLQTLVGGATPLNGYAWQAFRNKLINGNFDTWQRASSLASGVNRRYCADRFYTESIGTTYVSSQQAFVTGQGVVPYEPKYFHRVVVSSVVGAGNYCNFGQAVESVRTLAGQTAIFSFWAKADAARTIAIEFVQNFGSGGSPSASTSTGVTQKVLGTGWQFYTVQVTLPSLAGKTIGNNGDDYLGVRIWMDAGSNYNANTGSLGQQLGTFDFAQLQLEPGSSATPFELLPVEIQAVRTQRYFQRKFSNSTRFCVAYVFNSTTAEGIVSLLAPMRTVGAAVSVSNTTDFAAASPTGTNLAANGIGAISLNDPLSVFLRVTVASGLTAGNVSEIIGLNANAYVQVDSEYYN